MTPGNKATCLTYTMSLENFHKLLIGRLNPKGNETEVMEVCKEICRILNESYPKFIKKFEEYQAYNNLEKYKGRTYCKKILYEDSYAALLHNLKNQNIEISLKFFPVILVAKTVLTDTAIEIFKNLNLDTENSDLN